MISDSNLDTSAPPAEHPRAPMHTLLFLDPGHFHAALTLRVPQARASDVIFVYAPECAELHDFLALVERFNRRSRTPRAGAPSGPPPTTRPGRSSTSDCETWLS